MSFHKHHVFVSSAIIHMSIELKTLATFKRIAESFVFSKPLTKFYD